MTRPFIPLFWRLFVPNATVLAVASIGLLVAPANGRLLAVVVGLAALLVINLLLMRRVRGWSSGACWSVIYRRLPQMPSP